MKMKHQTFSTPETLSDFINRHDNVEPFQIVLNSVNQMWYLFYVDNNIDDDLPFKEE